MPCRRFARKRDRGQVTLSVKIPKLVERQQVYRLSFNIASAHLTKNKTMLHRLLYLLIIYIKIQTSDLWRP